METLATGYRGNVSLFRVTVETFPCFSAHRVTAETLGDVSTVTCRCFRFHATPIRLPWKHSGLVYRGNNRGIGVPWKHSRNRGTVETHAIGQPWKHSGMAYRGHLSDDGMERHAHRCSVETFASAEGKSECVCGVA